jgi:starvation-inducible DNA-binding protein
MEQLIQQMKVILGTNFGLYFKAHTFHWNVKGPDFAQYHDFLGDLYESIYGNVDTIAEKIRMLGMFAPTSLSRMMELSDIPETENVPDALTMMTTLKQDNDRFMVHLRAGIVAADEANEPAIGNFLQDLLDQHQKHAWMLRSFTE